MFKAFPFTISYPADGSAPYNLNAVVSQTVFNCPFIVKNFRAVQLYHDIGSNYFRIDVRLNCTYDLYTETLYYNTLISDLNFSNRSNTLILERSSLSVDDTYVTAVVTPTFNANNPSSVITLTYTGLSSTSASSIPAEFANFVLLAEGWNL
jgi:hypothetical protein